MTTTWKEVIPQEDFKGTKEEMQEEMQGEWQRD